jgi:predicted secreted protein
VIRRIAYGAAFSALLCGAVLAQEKPALREVPALDNGLFTLGLADQIRKTCPSISARMLAALGAYSDLRQTAREMGYTRDEVEAHLDSDAEKERLRARARAYFEQKGVRPDAAGHCTLGQMEIAAGSDVGRLLRMDN